MLKAGKDYVGVTTAFILTDGAGKILLVKRSNKCRDEHGTWDSGAGQLEVGFTLEENVRKEVREEYGSECEIMERLPFFDMIIQDGDFINHWIHFCFVVSVNPTKVKNNEPEKIEEMRWVYLWDLPSPLHSATEKALNIWRTKAWIKFSD